MRILEHNKLTDDSATAMKEVDDLVERTNHAAVSEDVLTEGVTHYWIVYHAGIECLFLGTPESFTAWAKREEASIN